MNRGSMFCGGLLLLILATAGMCHGVRAGLGQWLYYQSRYAPDKGNTAAILAKAHAAQRFYPYNYRLCEYAAQLADSAAAQSESPGRERLRAEARYWCERGLALNYYKRVLRDLMTDFLWQESPARAIRYWEEYTDWDFWEPYNHARLAEMYAKVGDWVLAERELNTWVDGSKYYDSTLEVIEKAKADPSGSTPFD